METVYRKRYLPMDSEVHTICWHSEGVLKELCFIFLDFKMPKALFVLDLGGQIALHTPTPAILHSTTRGPSAGTRSATVGESGVAFIKRFRDLGAKAS